MHQNPNFPGLHLGPRWGAYSTPLFPLADAGGARLPLPRTPPPLSALWASFLRVSRLRVQPITELATLLMIDFSVGLYEVSIFSVSENGENGLGDEGEDGGNAP